MSNDDELCQMFLATSLISTYEDTSNVIDITDPVLAAINMSKDDPSIKSLRAKTFKLVITITHSNKIGIQKYIRDMKTHKNCKLKDIILLFCYFFILIRHFSQVNVDSAKDIVLTIAC